MKADVTSKPPSQSPARVRKEMEQAVEEGVFPGAVLFVSKKGEVIFHQAFGSSCLIPEREPMRLQTIFDLASLTKVVATTTAIMILSERGKLELDYKVERFILGFGAEGKERITPRHLLTHSSGLIPWVEFYKLVSGEDCQKAKRFIYDEIHRMKLDYQTGAEAKYSDLGFIVLGEIVEKISGEDLDEFCQDEVFEPLGMRDTFFNNLTRAREDLRPEDFAATEDCPWRGKVLRGEVHDENAYAMVGVAGHAGLFSTAWDMGIFAQTLIDCLRGEGSFLRSSTVREFVRRQNLVPGSSRALGWDTPSEGSSAGKLLSPDSFGHTGFTGTSLWVDPTRDLIVILLTNRVHPSRDNTKLTKFRPRIHDLIVRELG